MRPKTPQHVLDYERSKKITPQCCHTCENYDLKGVCLRYRMTPPEDFAATIDACPDWIQDIPF